MIEVYVCDAVRTPFGRYGGALSAIRADDLGSLPLRALMTRNPSVEWARLDELYFGCANQAGEDNRNVARMAALLAGMPVEVPASTINRLCGSSLDAIAMAARAVASGEADLIIAGGVESMSRAPFVMGKADAAFVRTAKLEDTTMGWRFINPQFKASYGVDTMPETAENLVAERGITRAAQDAFALRSQQRYAVARARGFFNREIVSVMAGSGKTANTVAEDEHPRPDTTAAALAALKGVVTPGGSVTAGNSSGINDGAAAVLLASANAAHRHGLTPRARVVGSATAGVAPRIMGIGPVPASAKLLQRYGLTLADIDVIEINEAFAAQALAVLRDLGFSDHAEHVNANGGAIAIGHPLGASGARLVATAVNQLETTGSRRALCTMCIGVGQGIAMLLESV